MGDTVDPNAVVCEHTGCPEAGILKWAGLCDLGEPVWCGACGHQTAVVPDPIPVPAEYGGPGG